MSISTRLKSFLDENKIPYSVMTHMRAYTAQGDFGRIGRDDLVLRLVSCTNEYPLPRVVIVDDELSRPRLTKLSYKCCRIVKGFHGLDKMEVSVALHLEDTKG